MTERAVALAVAAALALACATARAAPNEAEQARAAAAAEAASVQRSRSAFDRARKFAEAEKWADACLLFQEAHDLHATGGTAIQLANCYEKINQPDRAVVYYQFILDHKDTERVDERVQIAQERLAVLRPERPSAAPAVVVKPLEIPFSARFTKPVIIALGVGVAGVTVGAIFGGVALGEASSVKDTCVGNVCPASQQSNVDGARAKGWVSTIAFGVGFVGLAAGAVLLAIGNPPAKAATPSTNGLGPPGASARFYTTHDAIGVRF